MSATGASEPRSGGPSDSARVADTVAPRPYYEHAGITIYHGDCRDVLPALHPDQFDVLVTDPPYGMKFVTGSGRKDGWQSRWAGIPIAGDETTALRDEVLAWWGARPALVFGSWKCPRPAMVREVLVWDKVVSTGMGALDIPWRPSWEAIYVIGHGFIGDRSHGVLPVSLPTLSPERHHHPTVKPIALLHELLRKCPPGAVLDPFMGSGSTLRAAKNLGRAAVGIEIEERYCEVAATRLGQEVLGFGEAS